MIWIEGKSTVWTYLSELELNPLVKQRQEFDRTQSVKTSDEIEKKAEELKQRILSASQKSYFPNYRAEVETYASSYKLPEDEIYFIDHRLERKIKKNTALGELLLTCFVIGLFMTGIYKGKSFFGAKRKDQNSVATQLNSGDQHAAQKNYEPAKVAFYAIDTIKKTGSSLALQKTRRKSSPHKKKVVDSSVKGFAQPVNTATANQDKKEETVIESPLQVKKEVVASVPEIKTGNETVKEGKKGFLRGLFKKKKNKRE